MDQSTPHTSSENSAKPLDASHASKVISAFSNFEDALTALRALYDEAQFKKAELEQREVDLVMRQNQVAERVREVENERAGLEAEVAKAQEERSTVEALRAEFESREQDLRRREAEHLEAVNQLTRRAEELEAESTASGEALERQGHELSQARAQVEQMRLSTEDQQGELARERQAIESMRQDVERRERDLKRTSQELMDAQSEIESLRTRLLEAEDLAEQRQHQVERAIARAGELGADLGRTLIRASELEAQVEEARRVTRVDPQAEAAHEAQVAELTERVRSLTEMVEEYEKSWRAEHAHVEELTASLQQRAEHLSELEVEIQSLRARLTEAEQAPGVAPDDAELRESLESARSLAAELQQEIERRDASQQEMLDRAEAAEREWTTAQDKLDTVAEELIKTKRMLREAESNAVAVMPSDREEALERRLTRLRHYKSLVRARADKLRKAGEMMKKKFDLCEQLLHQRAELSEVHQKLMQAQRKTQKVNAMGKAGVATMLTAVAVLIWAAMSWVVSMQVLPGRYVATTELRADGRGRALNPAELAEWQRYHEELLKDPRFVDAVAKRFARKSMDSMSSAGTVSKRMSEDLAYTSPADGVIKLEWIGDGPDRAERELDTVATALASEANAARTERIDGGSTTPPTPAKAASRPIDNTQFIAAASMMGGGTLFSLFVGFAAWRRLASAKTKFEQDTQMAAILEDAHWPDPRKM
ncbi:MAG: hypothetical protein AB7Q00_05665 [Phycisphaerales bacterium]